MLSEYVMCRRSQSLRRGADCRSMHRRDVRWAPAARSEALILPQLRSARACVFCPVAVQLASGASGRRANEADSARKSVTALG